MIPDYKQAILNAEDVVERQEVAIKCSGISVELEVDVMMTSRPREQGDGEGDERGGRIRGLIGGQRRRRRGREGRGSM